MQAALIAVGSELLRLGRRDSNGDWLTERLWRLGVEVRSRTTVEDDERVIAGALRRALDDARLVVLTGGLGPTDDDRTRAALALALDRPLERDPRQVEWLRRWFSDRGRRYHEVQSVQADRPRGATWIENPVGTAAGLSIETETHRVLALPGVPAEMRQMVGQVLEPWLAARSDSNLVARTLRVGGLPESVVEARVRDLYGEPGTDVTILSGGDGIVLHLRVRDADAATAGRRCEQLARRFQERLGADLYGVDEDRLAAVVGAALVRRGETVATAESCTGGLLAGALTSVPGSSSWFRGGLVVYSNELKSHLAGVESDLLERHGAVSEPVARALARGARARCGADVGLGITGIAGPGGGTPDKPVGLVHVALADRSGEAARSLRMVGDRTLVRERTVHWTLDWLRRRLTEREG